MFLPKVYQSKNLLRRSFLFFVVFSFVAVTNPSKVLAVGCSLLGGQCIEAECCKSAPITGGQCADPAEVCCHTLHTSCVVTPIGNIPTDPGKLVAFLITRAIGLGGGFALLLLMFGGFTYITSRGDSAKTKIAAEIMTAAVSGLLLIVFSVVILRILGRDILGIGNLGL